jgi:hypothetical protein
MIRKITVWFGLLLWVGSLVNGATGNSLPIRVDTRDLQMGGFQILGDAQAPYLGSVYLTAWHEGEDVTASSYWSVKSTRVISDWYGVPSISRGLLKTGHLQPGDILNVSASYQTPSGKRTDSKIVTVAPSNGLFFDMQPSVSFLEPVGADFRWSLAVTVSGTAVSKPGIVFSWQLAGEVGSKAGESVLWPSITGKPSLRLLTVTADDGQGNQRSISRTVSFPAPAPGNPGQLSFERWVKKGFQFADQDGELYSPDSSRVSDGLIVLTHGLNSSPYARWIQDLAKAIESRLIADGKPVPNIVIFGWANDASPERSNLTQAEKIKAISKWVYFGGSLASEFFAKFPGFADMAYDILIIKPMGETVGENALAAWLEEQADLGNVSRTAPIHMIGHSAGGFVIGSCYNKLYQSFNIQRLSLLDTPFFPWDVISRRGAAEVDRGVSSLFGVLAPASIGEQLDFVFGPGGKLESVEHRNDSTLYHVVDLLGWGVLKNPVQEHATAYKWYTDSVSGSKPGEGFELSPFLQSPMPMRASSSLMVADLSLSTPDAGLLMPLSDSESPPIPLGAFETFGNVTNTGTLYTVTEAGDGGVFINLAFAPDIYELVFDIRFTTAGDGDSVVLQIGDDPILWLRSAPAVAETNSITVSVPVWMYAGSTNVLSFTLAALNEAGTVVELDGIGYTTVPDIDADGIDSTDEILYGTSPVLADTDGDGITDYDEIFQTLTNPLLRDTDGDGLSDGAELIAGTNPLLDQSVLAVQIATPAPDQVELIWPTVPGKTYSVLRSDDLSFENYNRYEAGANEGETHQSLIIIEPSNQTRFYQIEVKP